MKKNNIIIRLAVVLLVGLFGFSDINNVLAVKKFTVSPMSQKVVLVPGETYRGGVTVANPSDSDEAFNYKVSVAPFSLNNNSVTDTEQGEPNYEDSTDYNQIVSWITLDNPKGSILPNGHTLVSFSINVPDDAPAGGQYASLLVGEDSGSSVNEDSLGVKEVIQMAHIIYAEVAGETREEADILENNFPTFLLSNKLSAASTVKNNGNIHADTEYTLQVWPLFSDEEIYTNEESPSTGFVMPGVTKYHNEECNLPMFGIFRVKQTVKIFGEISIVEKTIIVCPLWLMFIIVFVIIAIIIWLILKAKSRKGAKKTEE